MAHLVQMGEGGTSGFLFLQLSSLPPCWWEQGHSAIWSLFAVGGLQGGSEEKACWVRVPVLRLGSVQLHSTCLVRMGARWSPCKGTGEACCALQIVVCFRGLCEWEVAGKGAMSAELLGKLAGGGSHPLMACPEAPRKGVPLGPWGCRDSGLPGNGRPVSAQTP